MALTLTIVLVVAAVAVISVVAVQCLRHGWSSTGFMHGDGGSFFSDFSSIDGRFFDSGDCGGGDGGCGGD